MNSICKYFCCSHSRRKDSTKNKNDSPTTMSFLQLPGQTIATNKSRAQVALAPKHGLMDWIRTMNNTPNISGTNGRLLHVTEEELVKHNKKTDCWMALSENVYNITPYLDYHPGGIDEILRGAGQDGTALFQEVHSWVNFASMLEKCLVGRLISKPISKEQSASLAKKLPPRLRFDFRQPDDKTLMLFIYTTYITITKENILVSIENFRKITVFVFIDGFVHTIAIELFDLINNDINVRLSSNNRGQIEIDLTKQSEQKWKTIGKFSPKHLSVCSIQDLEPIFFSTTLMQRTAVTHDTDWYTFALPSNVFMCPPIGYHVRLRTLKDGVCIVKPYTVVKKLLDDEKTPSPEQTIELLIKHYPDRLMTPILQQLNIGDTIEMSSCEGTFDLTRIDRCQTLVLIAAGTGLTPMIRVITYALQQTKERNRMKIILLFFNKTQDDILCRDQLETLSNQSKEFQIHHILSRPDSQWTGETGYIRGELLQRFLPTKTDMLICVCGPIPFSKLANDLLKEQGYTDVHLHTFLA